MDVLQIFIGLIIQKVEQIHDYLQIVFSDDTTLSIYNNHCYEGGSILSVAGEKVISAVEVCGEIVFHFEGGGTLSIGMRDEDYNGPEAMELSRAGEPSVVWN